MIRIEALEFSYPDASLKLRVKSFQIATGEKLALIGPSGSGKTTLLNLVAGILLPQRGRIQCQDVEVSSLGDRQRRDFRIRSIGFVFQDFQLIEYLHVLDNILHPYRITGALRLTPQVRERARTLAAQMGMGDKLHRPVDRLSHGEQQRVAICRALLPSPALVLADEATGNLDPCNKGLILDLLFASVADQGATLLAVTHDHDLLPRFDRVVDIAEGQSRS